MAALLPYLIIGWLGVGYVLFRRLPGPVAALTVMVLGHLFLPELQGAPQVPGAPQVLPLPLVKFTKANTISYALLCGSLLCDRRRWGTVYPHWYDLPMFAWCVAPMFSSLVNEIGPLGGLYDGATLTLHQVLVWGVPYWMGRLYLGSREGLSLLAAAVVLGGLVYVPPCLFEIGFGPELHHLVYGYYQHELVQAVRFGGFRPMVFLQHGLEVGLWMTVAAVTAFWLWREGVYRGFVYHPRCRPVALGAVVLVVAGTAVACKSSGALILGAIGLAALAAARRFRTALPLAVLLVVPPAYIAARATNAWTGEELVAFTRANFDEERAASLDFRLRNENLLLTKSHDKPVFGFGQSGNWRIEDSRGKDKSVTDSLWIIALMTEGIFGLTALVVALLLPVVRFLWHDPPADWSQADAPAAVLALALSLYSLDLLVNAMVNPIYMLAAGGLAGAAAHLAPSRWDSDLPPGMTDSGVIVEEYPVFRRR